MVAKAYSLNHYSDSNLRNKDNMPVKCLFFILRIIFDNKKITMLCDWLLGCDQLLGDNRGAVNYIYEQLMIFMKI